MDRERLWEEYLWKQREISRRLQEISDMEAQALARSPTGSIDITPWQPERDRLLKRSNELIEEMMKRLGLDPNA